MKKFSLLLILLLSIFLMVSCKSKPVVDEDLNENGDEDQIIIEKPEPEKEEEPDEEEEPKTEEEKPGESVNSDLDNPDLNKIDKTAYVKVDNLNVRSQGNLEGKVISVVNKGLKIHIIGEKDNWYYVEYAEDKKGWVSSKYIQFEKPIVAKPATPKPTKPTTPKPTTTKPELRKIEKKAYVTVDGLNVRDLGSIKGKVIRVINRGVEVHVFGEKDNWYYIEYAKDKRGWVSSKYIQFEKLSSKPTKPPVDTGSLSNKSYSWYFTRNNKHEQPGFDSHYKALLDKYNGITIGSNNKKDIFLTFDNGYENGYTVKILDTLKKHNVKVGFFVQGTYIDKNPEIVKRMANEGHLVLNHTNNHPELPSISKAELQREINIVAEKYKKLTGREMAKFFRPPAGVFSERTLAETKALGYRTVFWSMAYRDWVVNDQPGKAAAYKHVTDNIHNGAVILLHSVSQSNTEALGDIIVELKRQGYNFKLLSQYP